LRKFVDENEYADALVPQRAGRGLKAGVQALAENPLREAGPNGSSKSCRLSSVTGNAYDGTWNEVSCGRHVG